MKLSAAVRNALIAASVFAAAAPVAIVSASPAGWFAGERVQGNGNVAKQAREVPSFNGLGLGLPGSVEVRIGNTESVTIESDDNILPLIETVVEDGTLKIRPVRRNLQLDTRNLKVVVIARKLERIAVGGSGSVDATGIRGGKLHFDVGGSGSMNLRDIEGESVSVSLGGSGNLKASGSADKLKVSIGGSGKVSTGQLATREATVSIGGSGQAVVWAKQSLSVSVAGSGDVSYYGEPQITKSLMGSGSVKHLAGSPN
ncbi:head GIN domain-containing protein [Pseudoduganella violaceinigra]|uniref:head GIN domain-containing protein n=1 Tax=Pseudoduganella violaceinigra TaxID=246602 RepID=UPI00040110FF|nr:head GIN domain-containing protein [Pseudoduganella violaceinigra]